MKFLQEVILQLFGIENEPSFIKSVGGGCIHQAGMFEYDGNSYFIKWNKDAATMFEAEARGLAILSWSDSINIPQVIGYGTAMNTDYLCMEFVSSASQGVNFWKNFGSSLAALHQKSASYFGLDHDNFIGSLPQCNTKHVDWIAFFINERIKPQLKLARNKGLVDSDLCSGFDLLFTKLPELIPAEKPALLHGDLWSGNFLIGNDGQPVIFDPAVYYGHREAEIAFAKLFGGFDTSFYHSYDEAFPLQPGHEERANIFNLYPLLVHVNLFGSSYLSGIQRTLSRFT